jgi:hypothetical protein
MMQHLRRAEQSIGQRSVLAFGSQPIAALHSGSRCWPVCTTHIMCSSPGQLQWGSRCHPYLAASSWLPSRPSRLHSTHTAQHTTKHSTFCDAARHKKAKGLGPCTCTAVRVSCLGCAHALLRLSLQADSGSSTHASWFAAGQKATACHPGCGTCASKDSAAVEPAACRSCRQHQGRVGCSSNKIIVVRIRSFKRISGCRHCVCTCSEDQLPVSPWCLQQLLPAIHLNTATQVTHACALTSAHVRVHLSTFQGRLSSPGQGVSAAAGSQLDARHPPTRGQVCSSGPLSPAPTAITITEAAERCGQQANTNNVAVCLPALSKSLCSPSGPSCKQLAYWQLCSFKVQHCAQHSRCRYAVCLLHTLLHDRHCLLDISWCCCGPESRRTGQQVGALPQVQLATCKGHHQR